MLIHQKQYTRKQVELVASHGNIISVISISEYIYCKKPHHRHYHLHSSPEKDARMKTEKRNVRLEKENNVISPKSKNVK